MWSRIDAGLVRLVCAVPERRRRMAGVAALIALAWIGIYGHLGSFERLEEHRLMARALLTGTLRLRGAVSQVENDEQIHDGAVYTNWGYGVPLLQAPFHALAGALGLHGGFFPDRAIYFVCAALMMPVLWAAFDRLFCDRSAGAPPRNAGADGRRAALSWAATWVALATALFPLTSTRFVIYEETVAYSLVFQFLAASAYVFCMRSESAAPAAGLGAAAGMALLVRPTGILYAGVWTLTVALERRTRKAVALIAALAPFVAFWLFTNRVRTGSVFGLGFPNTTPAWNYNLPIERFGSECSRTPWHALLAAARLFCGFFLFVSRKSSLPWLRQCHFDFEERAGVLPFFGPIVLAGLVLMLRRLLRDRERRLAFYLPYAAMALLFASFVRRGEGFAWRYTGDFWPAILLATIHHLRRDPGPLVRACDPRLSKGLFYYGLVVFLSFILPWCWSPWPEIESAAQVAGMQARFVAARWGHDEPLPSRVSCGDALAPIFQNGAGWLDGCRVDTFTNVLLGVPPGAGDHFRVRALTEGLGGDPSARIYVNGAIYDARRVGDAYEADVTIHRTALVSPVVVVTVQWTRGSVAPPGKLLSIELG